MIVVVQRSDLLPITVTTLPAVVILSRRDGEGPHTGSRITLVTSSVSQRVDVRSTLHPVAAPAIRDDNAVCYRALALARCFENDLAADNGHDATRVQNFRLRNSHDVLRKNGEVRQLAHLD
jgi:hypothetical protein